MSARLKILLDLLASSPEDSFISFAIAKEYEKAGADQEALAWYKKLVEMDENYVGTYYHLAKLLERQQCPEEALAVYDQGINIAKKINDQHALAELQNASMNLTLGL